MPVALIGFRANGGGGLVGRQTLKCRGKKSTWVVPFTPPGKLDLSCSTDNADCSQLRYALKNRFLSQYLSTA
jgi:hypothetical protein